MTVHDICDVPADVDVPVDVCVVGSGPAGMTVARELAAAGRRVTVLESGGLADAGGAGDLSTIESVGAPRVMDQTLVRERGLGGTSRVWSGRLATFDEQDFRARSWVPLSGWPVDRADLSRYFGRSAEALGGPVADNNARSHQADRALGMLPAFDPAVFSPYFWTFSSDPDRPGDFLWFGRDADRCRRSDIEFVVNATVTQLVPDPVQNMIIAVEAAGPDHRTRTFVPHVVILCAGGIENPRLLLSSNRISDAGVGNRHDQVGRYLMDHPRGPVGSFSNADGDRVGRLLANVQLAAAGRISRRRSATVGLALSPRLQEAEQLLNCSLWAVPQRSPRDPLSSLLSLPRQRSVPSVVSHVARAARGAPGIVQGLLDTAVRHRSPRRLLDRLDLYCMVEQGPDPSSRITLSAQRDRLGVPIARVDWKIGAREARTVRRTAELFASEMKRLGQPVPDLADVIADASAPLGFPDIAHPTGTTRMSRDPVSGVVDENCRVHGIANLYVAGSSVFPTSGHANPTQMIVAMALRLADFVIRTHPPQAFATDGDRSASEAEFTATAPIGRRVLVTGAGGKVGRLLLTRLVENGYQVRALTSRPREQATDRDEVVLEWVTHDLAAEPIDNTLLDGVDAVVHLAAVQRGDTVQAVNVDATATLFEACERAGVPFFCHLSSISVYGSPQLWSTSTEHAATIDGRSPVERQYWTNADLRAYGESKIAAENAIRARHRGVTRCTVFRPTIIVDGADVEAHRAAIRRGTASNPRALQLVHNEDVVRAILWALERDAGSFEVFNLADNDVACRYESDVEALVGGAGAHSGRTLRTFLKLAYWLGSAARFYRGGRLRLPLGLASYPNDKLISAGFRFTMGMRNAWLGRSESSGASSGFRDDTASKPYANTN